MAGSELPDTKTHLINVINALRMSAFPRAIYGFADACAGNFIPTKTRARVTAEKITRFKNDPAFRHWISESAEIEDVIYCRTAIQMIGVAMDQADLEQMQALTARVVAAPLFATSSFTGSKCLCDRLHPNSDRYLSVITVYCLGMIAMTLLGSFAMDSFTVMGASVTRHS